MTSQLHRPSPTWGRAFLGAVAVACIAYFFLTTSSQSVLYNVVAVAAAMMIFIGISAGRPEPLSAWVLVASGILLWAMGDILYGISRPVPSIADLLYVSAYPVLGLGLIRLARKEDTRGSAYMEAAIIGLEAGMLVMFLLLVITEGGQGFLTRAVSIGYVIMDVTLLGILIRVAPSDPERVLTFRLIGVALILTLIADIGYVLLDFGTDYVVGEPLDVAWLLAYGCFGAAVFNPSILQGGHRRNGSQEPSGPPPEQGGRSWARAT